MTVEARAPERGEGAGTRGGAAVAVRGLTKEYRGHRAVDGVSFTVARGRVTGFLGPNGAGKSTTLRMVFGLVRPDAGDAGVFGRPYRELRSPARRVGAALEPGAFVPGRTGRNHLLCAAGPAGCGPERVDEVLETVGLTDAARRRVGGYSTGMRQRLALATALLGEPELLVLDEPANGLDPAGMLWLRRFLRGFAEAGGSVLLSSHLLGEMEQTVDDVVLLDRGRLVHEGPLEELLHDRQCVLSAPSGARPAALAEAIAQAVGAAGLRARVLPDDRVWVDAPEREALAALEGREGTASTAEGVRAERCTLESAFLKLTGDENDENGGRA
ncbi:ABC transporter ATP-binding protein [Nocardiopsis sp. RSe5-2]|uniref:ABC transporter ATP-binding protein n=1 Tax=Nocardiopsis endophytica TaxID=3018445 RepID=A0ABT4UDG7_9ACTN|nr:ABC transporter ATP-binding protein [Nocardiopsis endophytica]MDA2815035.1 ABC transporter ATP-binding protein [Nocardiopsis endophytica]